MKAVYTASVTATGGRDGKVRSSDGLLETTLATAKEMGGPGGATNPEQLFAAGYAACFLSAFKRAAANRKMAVRDIEVTVENTINARDEGGFIFSVKILASVGGMEKKVAEELAATAETICPFANSTRGNVETNVVVTVK